MYAQCAHWIVHPQRVVPHELIPMLTQTPATFEAKRGTLKYTMLAWAQEWAPNASIGWQVLLLGCAMRRQNPGMHHSWPTKWSWGETLCNLPMWTLDCEDVRYKCWKSKRSHRRVSVWVHAHWFGCGCTPKGLVEAPEESTLLCIHANKRSLFHEP